MTLTSAARASSLPKKPGATNVKGSYRGHALLSASGGHPVVTPSLDVSDLATVVPQSPREGLSGLDIVEDEPGPASRSEHAEPETPLT